MSFRGKHEFLAATVHVAVAIVVLCTLTSCKTKLKTAQSLDLSKTPVQTVKDMYIVQSDNGKMQLRVEAPVMERYQSDSCNWEIFTEGFRTYAYDENGKLETSIVADHAKHIKPKSGAEVWMAFGNVKVSNLIKRETMESDTLYWDRDNEKIYTDCYVRLVSPDGFMQGYGIESDQRARNSVIRRPFNSYALVQKDSTEIMIDSTNFIGPFPIFSGT